MSGTTEGVPRAITACIRCRTRKIRCDRKFPTCTSCLKASVECAALDRATGRSVPRSYVSYLEDRVAALEQEIAVLRMSATSITTSNRNSDSPNLSRSSLSPGPNSPKSTTETAISGDKALSFAKMMFSAVKSPDATSLETPLQSSTMPANLPQLAEMHNLLHVYFNHSYPQVPVTSPEQANTYIQQTYFPSSPTLSDEGKKTALYFIHILAAIAYARDPSDGRAEKQHAAALVYLPLVFKKGSRLTSLEAILLLTVYGTNRPSTPGIWYTLGVASRLITDLSLESSSNETSETERRVFWSWYSLDRQICVYLSRPVAISDNVIHCPFPVLDPVPKAFCELRVMQSEIQRILHHSDTLPREYASLEQWRVYLDRRLEHWNAQRPMNNEDARSDFNLLFLTLNYEQTRLLLHGFSSNLPITTEVVLSSAQTIVEIYNALWVEDAVNFIWLAIHNVYIAASSFIYACVNAPMPMMETQFDGMVFRVGDMLTGMSTRSPAALQILANFEDLVKEVKSRYHATKQEVQNSQLLLSHRTSSTSPMAMAHSHDASTLSNARNNEQDQAFMQVMNNVNPLWNDFLAGDDFTFMEF